MHGARCGADGDKRCPTAPAAPRVRQEVLVHDVVVLQGSPSSRIWSSPACSYMSWHRTTTMLDGAEDGDLTHDLPTLPRLKQASTRLSTRGDGGTAMHGSTRSSTLSLGIQVT